MFQEKLIFFPEKLPRDYAFSLPAGAKEVFLQTSSGNEINALHYRTALNHSSNLVVLYFHGNAGSLRGWQTISADFTSRGADLLMIDYHGYGKSSGEVFRTGVLRGCGRFVQLSAKGRLRAKPDRCLRTLSRQRHCSGSGGAKASGGADTGIAIFKLASAWKRKIQILVSSPLGKIPLR